MAALRLPSRTCGGEGAGVGGSFAFAATVAGRFFRSGLACFATLSHSARSSSERSRRLTAAPGDGGDDATYAQAASF
jgi:hypothetical protein